jgi:hypothetical protein
MNKSFRDRLAALEALEYQAELDRSPLTPEDRTLLGDMVSIHVVTLNGSGCLVRNRDYGDTAAIDRALARYNAALLALQPRLMTLEAVDLWVRDLDDPDSFDEDELLFQVWVGLEHKHAKFAEMPPVGTLVSFAGGVLRATISCPGCLRSWSARIVERATLIIKAREISFFPLFPEDIRAALELIDAGEMTCQAPWSSAYRSHRYRIKVPHGSVHTGLCDRVASAFDQYMYQVNGALLETTEELRADLVEALEQFKDEELEETA